MFRINGLVVASINSGLCENWGCWKTKGINRSCSLNNPQWRPTWSLWGCSSHIILGENMNSHRFSGFHDFTKGSGDSAFPLCPSRCLTTWFCDWLIETFFFPCWNDRLIVWYESIVPIFDACRLVVEQYHSIFPINLSCFLLSTKQKRINTTKLSCLLSVLWLLLQ